MKLASATSRVLRRLLFSILALTLLVSNLRLIAPVDVPANHSDVEHHLRFARGRVDDGLASQMQSYFPEGHFFTYVLYGLSWVNIGLGQSDDVTKQEALREARFALDELDSPEGRAPFSPNLSPSYGIFYVGWSNYLRAGIIALQDTPDQRELDALIENCDSTIQAMRQASSPFLTSYPGQAWPVDMYPALVSIKACDEFTDRTYQGQTYAEVIEDWLDAADQTVDPVHGLVGHRSEPYIEHPRATSQTLILRFLAELDQDRARAGYLRFREQHQSAIIGLPVIREHPFGIDEPGDVDSGPLIFGATASGTVVAMATAQANGDHALASALQQQARSGGFPIRGPGGSRYALGVLPIGDLFVIWARTSHLWFQDEQSADAGTRTVNQTVDSTVLWWWRLPIQLLSITTLAVSWLLLWPGLRRRWRSFRGFGKPHAGSIGQT